VVLSVSFVVLSVFMSVPQPGAGVHGETETGQTDPYVHHGHQHVVDDRPVTTCHSEVSSEESCQNFARNSITDISTQIRMELNASHTYMSMAAYFGRDDQAYRGFAKFFRKASDEERDHAMLLIDYLNKRGGYATLKTVHAPKVEWPGGPLEAVTDALSLEHEVNSALLDLHWDAQHKNDPHFQDFLESEFLIEQVDSIRELASWKTILTRLQGDPLGLHQFDEELWNGSRG